MDRTQPLNSFFRLSIHCKVFISKFYREENLLFMKCNGHIRDVLMYTGNNIFNVGNANAVSFELLDNGLVKVQVHFVIALKKSLILKESKRLNINSTLTK